MSESINAGNSVNTSKKRGRGNPDKIKPFQFKPGQSGNPEGRPKGDKAAEIARAIFESAPDEIKEKMLMALKKGNPKVFDVLANRAYGRMPQAVTIDANVTVNLAERMEAAQKRLEKEPEEK